MYRVKVLVDYRSGEAEDHLSNWKLTAVPGLRRADMIVVSSGYLQSVFARFGLNARTIYDVVELDTFAYRDRLPIRPVFLTSRLHEPLYNVPRSEEHTSELQSQSNLVCRLLLEKK